METEHQKSEDRETWRQNSKTMKTERHGDRTPELKTQRYIETEHRNYEHKETLRQNTKAMNTERYGD